ncbi:hypothetical protein DPMN_076103 [Dreissena polymorpha]|uniref:Uncharacterized protein n=1 Tax=Dreissena polymorpha TaxID=45954 RepID=A0A9D4BM45_DREPO|nr:hypothetical protein DPMN_076103 [Dreissena polymorpha]
MDAANKPSHQYFVDLIKEQTVNVAAKYLLEIGCKASFNTVHKDLSRMYQKFQHLNKIKHRVKGKNNLDKFRNDLYQFPDTITDMIDDCPTSSQFASTSEAVVYKSDSWHQKCPF